MRHAIAWAVISCLPALLLVGPAVAQKKDSDKDGDTDKSGEKWVKVGSITGRVTNVYEDKRKLQIQIQTAVMRPNLGSLGQAQAAQMSYAIARARGDRVGMLTALQQMRQAQVSMYTLERVSRDVEVQALDDVVVRAAQPKQEFDDKGRLKKLTRAELKEQKGPDPKMVGYKAEFSDIQTESIVQMTVVRKKSAPAPKPKVRAVAKKGKAKDKDQENEAELDALLEDNTPQVSMIIILAGPPAR